MQRWIMSAPLFSIHFNRAIIAASLGARNARRQASACARRICRHTPCRNRGLTWRSPYPPTGSACACCTYRPTLCRNCGFTRHLSCSPTGFGMRMSRVPPCSMLELRLHSALVMPGDRLRHAHVARTALHPAGITASLGARHTRRPALTRAPSAPRKTKSPAIRPGK